MKTNKRLTSTLAAAFIFAGGVSSAQGAVVVTAVQSGGDVVISGGGTLNLAAWGNRFEERNGGRINPSTAYVLVGPGPNIANDRYQIGVNTNYSGPTSFGSGSDSAADPADPAVAGDLFGMFSVSANIGDVSVPRGYAGEELSGFSTYSGETFASLGMDIGTYTWTWGSGATADSFTMNVVPIPAAAWLFGSGLVALGAVARRRKQTV